MPLLRHSRNFTDLIIQICEHVHNTSEMMRYARRIKLHLSDHQSVDLRADVGEGVQNGVCLSVKTHSLAIRRLGAYGVQVHVDWLLWVAEVQPEQLRDDQLCHCWYKLHRTLQH